MSSTATTSRSQGQFASFVSIGKRHSGTVQNRLASSSVEVNPSAPLPKDLLVVVTDARGAHRQAVYTIRSRGRARDKAAMLSSVPMHAAQPKTAIAAPPVDPSAADPASQLQAMVDQGLIKRADPLVVKLQQKGVQDVLNGTVWLTSKEVGEQADPLAKNKHSLASRWLKEHRVFAIFRRGQNEFPEYQFDPLGQPIDAIGKVLEVFKGYHPFRVAAWFESASSILGGRRPREVIAQEPMAVIDAAAAHVRGAVHG